MPTTVGKRAGTVTSQNPTREPSSLVLGTLSTRNTSLGTIITVPCTEIVQVACLRPYIGGIWTCTANYVPKMRYEALTS